MTVDKMKDFRTQLLDFINHNLEVGYINKDMTVDDFTLYVDKDLGNYIEIMDKVNTSILERG